MSFYERGPVRIHYEERGSGTPLLVIAGGGLNSTIAGLAGEQSPYNPLTEFSSEYRVIAADLRNAAGGKVQSFGRGRARRWMTPPLPGFTTTLLLPAPLPID